MLWVCTFPSLRKRAEGFWVTKLLVPVSVSGWERIKGSSFEIGKLRHTGFPHSGVSIPLCPC